MIKILTESISYIDKKMAKKTELKASVSVTLRMPSLPNFVQYNNDKWVDVADLPEDQLRKLAGLWTEELIANAKRRRQNK